ncbi:hypothetical protein SDC9_77732 [bioreactor metagenome]|uniref:Uncharacterized protein n=1 Tax=bioreactor metagenome TaxID=1076179 RepID=A0A644YT89_9ZZZZ
MRFPNIKNPTREMEAGATRPAINVTTIGNKSLVILETLFGLYFILILRSFSVVHIFIAKGCIIGTSAMYEYAATAIGPM